MITPRHLWTNGGKEVLCLRFVAKDGTSYSGRDRAGKEITFKHPTKVGERVTAPDWNPDDKCGGGIHAWPWGFSLGDGKEPDWSATWLVYGVDPGDIVGESGELQGKCKFRTGVLRHVGTWDSAMLFILPGQMAWVAHAARGAASATGWSGAASATGASGAASATGESGAASATGWRGAASATGWSGAASATGEYSTVECGNNGLAVSTADEVTWIARPGAIFVHRWTGENPGCKRATFKSIRAVDGERITFNCGKIIKRVKP